MKTKYTGHIAWGLAALLSAGGVSAVMASEPWFDAKIGETATWPSGNADLAIEDNGTWQHTSFAELVVEGSSARLAVTAPKDDALRFGLSDAKVAGEEFMTITTKVRLVVADPEEPLPAAAPLGALTTVGTAYYGLLLDAEGGTNVWMRLDGAVPQDGEDVTLSFSMRPGDGVNEVRYAVDGRALTFGGEEWLPMAPCAVTDAASIVSVDYFGNCVVSSLAGVVGEESPAEEFVVEPGYPAEVPAADADAAIAAVVFKVEVPTDGAGAAVVEESAYKGYFTLVAASIPGETGFYSVSAVLDESLVRPVIEKTVAIDVPFTVDEETSAVTVAAKKGLYYSLLRGATLDAIEEVVDSQLATGETVTLTDGAKIQAAAFYRVAVSFLQLDGQ